MNILIFGASGATGHELVKQGLEQGHTVTAFVRNPAKLKVDHEKIKMHQGDVKDFIAVEKAVSGQDAVLSALGASSPFKYDPVVVEGVGNIIKAMEQSGIKRFIYLSFIGVKESRKDAPIFIKYIASKILRTEIAGHEAKENMIKQSNLAWTIVRPATLTNGPKKGVYRFGEDLKSNAFMVTSSRADVADFMLKQISDDRFYQKSVRIMY